MSQLNFQIPQMIGLEITEQESKYKSSPIHLELESGKRPGAQVL